MRVYSIIFALFIFCESPAQHSEISPWLRMEVKLNGHFINEKKIQFEPKEYFPSKWSFGPSFGFIVKSEKRISFKCTYSLFKNQSVNTGINDSGYPTKIYSESAYEINNNILGLSVGFSKGFNCVELVPLLGIEAWNRNIVSNKKVQSTYYSLPDYPEIYPESPPDIRVYHTYEGSRSWRSVCLHAGFDLNIYLAQKWQMGMSLMAVYAHYGGNWRTNGDESKRMLRIGLGMSYIFFKSMKTNIED